MPVSGNRKLTSGLRPDLLVKQACYPPNGKKGWMILRPSFHSSQDASPALSCQVDVDCSDRLHLGVSLTDLISEPHLGNARFE